ncbi:hypothetical protein O163_06095 [Caldanaerobacter subterraneus subsp. yonseiensis KB-1]|uniref:Uncharacterized protein n=1 Tax=Caldanaerobacter subterraneus subsp. yonseiensis KB-1 TaxID=1388761 RepID=U5CW13_CALSX|nr:hypothetical protein O163_06095 [Caldanaerobacter subterraneus subsp. yonseiensis KB-1]
MSVIFAFLYWKKSNFKCIIMVTGGKIKIKLKIKQEFETF